MEARQSSPHRSPGWLPALALVLCLALTSALAAPAPATAQAPVGFALVKDFGDTIYPGESLSTGGALSYRGAFVSGSIAYFLAYAPDSAYEIWRSDGTEAGTFLLKDICPGDGYQFPPPQFVALGASVYFAADDCVSGKELWKSDGTMAGTRRVKDINPGSNSSRPENLFVAGGKLFFTAYGGSGGSDGIWKSDGTEAGTTATGVTGTPIFVLGNGLFFTTYAGGSCKIKRLDATTNAVSDLTTMCPRGIYNNGSGVSIAAGATLAYYTAGDTSTGAEIWRSDGTPAGTYLLLDIRFGQETSQPMNFAVAQDQLFFAANDGANGQELWKSDGTTANTVMVKNIDAGPSSSSPYNITVWNGIVYFSAYDGLSTELWRSDGYMQNTAIVKDLTPTAGVSTSPSFLTPAANALFFIATDGTHAGALFKTDGTANGTVLVKDVKSYAPTALGAGVFFLGQDQTHGGEPWFSDGTDGGTRMIKDIAGPETGSTRPYLLTPLNGQALYFGYNIGGGTSGEFYALYRSDGSAGGTQQLKTFAAAPESQYDTARAPAVFNGALYFPATQGGTYDIELWRSNGTVGGTARFADLYPGNTGSNPRWLTPSGQTLFFRAANSANGDELWKTNGTLETTALVKDIRLGNTGSSPDYLVADGAGGVYFAADDGISGNELWHSDGSAANTRLLLDIGPSGEDSYPENLTLAGTQLFFTAEDGTTGRELWVTNGTPEGTKRVRDITPNASGTSFAPYRQPFAALGNRVFFVASSDLFGYELWTSDGTEDGTSIVKDVYPGAGSSDIQELRVMNGALYFVATGDDGKRTLWRSDGTTAGTRRVVDDSNAPVNPEALSAIDGRLYFSAADQPASAGRELWISDGTAGGTRVFQDLNAGPTNSNPRGMIKAGNRLYLGAYKPGAGVELWSAQAQQYVYLPVTRR
jgi:ELWxxDGT repeat protein